MDTRSPNAQRFEPPVHKLQWTSDMRRTGGECLEALRNLVGASEEAWERILWHGGVHLNRRRVFTQHGIADVAAGSQASVYWFSREPDPIAVAASDLCYDDTELVAVNKPAWLPVQGTRASIRYSL